MMVDSKRLMFYQSRELTPAPESVTSWHEIMRTKHWSTRSASMLLKLKRQRSPERVDMPESGCFGMRSTGKAAMNCVFP